MVFEIIFIIITHSIAFILGIAFDYYILKRLIKSQAKPALNTGEIIRVIVLLAIFCTYLASIVQSQFFSGEAPAMALTAMGIFSFGSLIGEKEFFAKLLGNFIKK